MGLVISELDLRTKVYIDALSPHLYDTEIWCRFTHWSKVKIVGRGGEEKIPWPSHEPSPVRPTLF